MIDRKMSLSTHTSTFTKDSKNKYKPTFTESPTVIGLTLSRSDFLPCYHPQIVPQLCFHYVQDRLFFLLQYD